MKTLFRKIRWKNLYATGSDFIEVQLDRHQRILFLGSNGCGKSTMIDALCYALYKKPFRKVTLPQMINTQTGKNMLVEVEFEAGGNEYMVRRGHKPTVFEIFKNGDLIDQNAVGGDYQELLETHILSMDFKSFIQIVILGFANYTPFMKLTTPQRREVVEGLLSYQVFSVMNSILKEEVTSTKNDLVMIEQRIRSSEERLDLNNKHVQALKEDHQEQIEMKKHELKVAEQTIHNAKVMVNQLTKDMDKLLEGTDDRYQIEADIQKAEDTRKQLLNKVRDIEKEIKFYDDNDNCPTCRQEISKEFVTERVTNRKKKVSELEYAINKILTMREPWIERLVEINNKVAEATNINAQIRSLDTEILTNQRFADGFKRDILELEDKAQKQVYQDISKELKDELFHLNESRDELLAQSDLHAKAALLLKDSGIKARLIRNFVPIMNELTNKYLEELQFFGHFEMDENFDAAIRAHDRDELSYEGLSQGQKLRIDLALLFTWRAIAGMRSNASTNLLIFDEILDSSLDDDGIDDLLRILSQMTEGHNITIISHRGEGFADKFDQVYRFSLVRGFTQIKEAA